MRQLFGNSVIDGIGGTRRRGKCTATPCFRGWWCIANFRGASGADVSCLREPVYGCSGRRGRIPNAPLRGEKSAGVVHRWCFARRVGATSRCDIVGTLCDIACHFFAQNSRFRTENGYSKHASIANFTRFAAKVSARERLERNVTAPCHFANVGRCFGLLFTRATWRRFRAGSRWFRAANR